MTMKAIRKIIDSVKVENRLALTEIESKQILQHLGITVPDFRLARSAEEAVKQAQSLSFPLALKIVSPDIVHKSDAKGVLLNIKNEAELRAAYEKIVKNAKEHNPTAVIFGVCVQKMIEGTTEVIIGMNRDRVFGPVLLFGVGGIFVEVMKDVTLKVLPLADKDIDNMFNEIQASKVLTGFRGTKPLDFACLKKMIKKVAELTEEFPEISEFELNPVMVYDQGLGAVALDARIILDHGKEEVEAS